MTYKNQLSRTLKKLNEEKFQGGRMKLSVKSKF